MEIFKSIYKIFNGTDWDEHYFKTVSSQVVHTKDDGTAITAEEMLNELNGKTAIKFINYNLSGTADVAVQYLCDMIENDYGKDALYYGHCSWVGVSYGADAVLKKTTEADGTIYYSGMLNKVKGSGSFLFTYVPTDNILHLQQIFPSKSIQYLNDNKCKYMSAGGNVTVWGESYGDTELTGGEYTHIATLPEGFRPAFAVLEKGNALGGNAGVMSRVDTDGKVYVYVSTDATYWSYKTTFPVPV